MPTFISTKSATNRHGVFAIEQQPGTFISSTGTGVVAIVAQFPWGPDGVIYQPPSIKDATNNMAPPGMSRTGSGYLSLIAKAFPSLRIVRVLGPTAAKATIAINKSGPTLMLTVTLKYKGLAGNSVTATTAAATDGDANHFNLTVTVTGASGTTTEVYSNLNYSGVGADSTPDTTNSLLVGSFAKNSSGVPLMQGWTATGGLDGSVTSAEYVGTAGTADKGIALLEGDETIRHVFCDDCGNSLRAAVNAGLKAHAIARGDREVYINGNSGQTAASAQTDAGNYVTDRVVYCDPWAFEFDDTTGAEQMIPSASWYASVAARLSPSTSIAWKNKEVRDMLAGISRLEFYRGDAAGTNTTMGIATLIKHPKGGHAIEASVTTQNRSDPSTGTLERRRMGDFIAVSFVQSTYESTDAPNVPVNQDDVVTALDTFLGSLKRAKDRDPNHNPHIVNYQITPVSASNTQYEIDSGTFTVEATVKESSSMGRIFLSLKHGPTVSIVVT